MSSSVYCKVRFNKRRSNASQQLLTMKYVSLPFPVVKNSFTNIQKGHSDSVAYYIPAVYSQLGPISWMSIM